MLLQDLEKAVVPPSGAGAVVPRSPFFGPFPELLPAKASAVMLQQRLANCERLMGTPGARRAACEELCVCSELFAAVPWTVQQRGEEIFQTALDMLEFLEEKYARGIKK